TRAAGLAAGVRGSQHRSSARKDLQAGRPPLGDGVLGNVQRLQRGQLAALSGQPAVIAVWSGADRGTEAAPGARGPVGFLTRRVDGKARKGRKAATPGNMAAAPLRLPGRSSFRDT